MLMLFIVDIVHIMIIILENCVKSIKLIQIEDYTQLNVYQVAAVVG